MKSLYLCIMKATDSRYCNCVYFSSGALARKIEKKAIEVWDSVKLSPSHGYLLLMVLDQPGIQPTAIVEELLLAPSTITRLIEKLEEKKLVRRTAEGKITNVYPTARAKAMRGQFQECLDTFYQSFSDILGKDESAKLVHAMNRITDKL